MAAKLAKGAKGSSLGFTRLSGENNVGAQGNWDPVSYTHLTLPTKA